MVTTLNDKPIEDLLEDKEALLRDFDAMERRLGIEHVSGATAREGRRLMLEAGVRSEDNILSSEMLRERYPGETAPP
jgi:hypothetical protein